MTHDRHREAAKRFLSSWFYSYDHENVTEALAEVFRLRDREAEAAGLERAAELAKREDVVKAMGKYADLRPSKGDGWEEFWPHAGYRIAAALYAEAAAVRQGVDRG